jgi:hypothetical protein
MAYIGLAVDDTHSGHLRDITDPAQAWAKLKRIYADRATASILKHKRELAAFIKAPSESIAAYASRLIDLTSPIRTWWPRSSTASRPTTTSCAPLWRTPRRSRRSMWYFPNSSLKKPSSWPSCPPTEPRPTASSTTTATCAARRAQPWLWRAWQPRLQRPQRGLPAPRLRRLRPQRQHQHIRLPCHARRPPVPLLQAQGPPHPGLLKRMEADGACRRGTPD